MMDQKPVNIHVVNTLSDLLIGLFKNDKNIIFLDEAGIQASSSYRVTQRFFQRFG